MFVEENISRISNGKKKIIMSKSTMFCLILSVLIYLINANKIVAKCVKKWKPRSESYDVMRKYDKTHYRLENPATEILSKKRYIEEEKKKWFR